MDNVRNLNSLQQSVQNLIQQTQAQNQQYGQPQFQQPMMQVNPIPATQIVPPVQSRQVQYVDGLQGAKVYIVQGFNAIQQSLAELGYHMDSCCCSIKTQMLQDKYEALENQYRTAQNDLSNAAQSQYILNALGRFVAYPPAAATAVTGG